MFEYSSGAVRDVAAPSIAPFERPIDLDHLSRMTLGDRGLEREVLALFERQATMLLERMRASAPAVAAASAHALKGSARGIGAWAVERAAAAVELTATRDAASLAPALETLAASIDETRGAIADLMRAH